MILEDELAAIIAKQRETEERGCWQDRAIGKLTIDIVPFWNWNHH